MAPLSDPDPVDVFKPEWYKDDPVTNLDMNVVSIFWGMALMLAVFTFSKAARQTARSWARHRRITAYVAMIWGAWIMNVTPSIVTWFHFYGEIPSRHVCGVSFFSYPFISPSPLPSVMCRVGYRGLLACSGVPTPEFPEPSGWLPLRSLEFGY